VILIQLYLVGALASAMTVTDGSKPSPNIYYTVTIDTADLSGFDVTMRIEGAPRSIRLAMAVHPEYDDRFWRYVRGLRAESVGKPTHLAFAIEADNAWRIQTRNGYATVRYRIELPRENPSNRGAWRTTLRADGASLNSTDTFLYLTDFPLAHVSVSLNIPKGWQIASSLYRRLDDIMYSSGGVVYQPPLEGTTTELLDSPILLGALRTWSFAVQGVPHRIVYWPLPNATPFDTAQFVDAIKKVSTEAVNVFGEPPYAGYTFLLEDGAWGALEHMNSVTIGMPSTDLAKDSRAYLAELAHEFFHTWNLVRLYPQGRGTLSDRQPEHATGLWLSEGTTIYYADVLLRRAGYPEGGLSRTDHLARLLKSYFASPGNLRISPELASARAVDTTGINGDYQPNYYVQGNLIGNALELIIRDSTNGRRGMDDVMRVLYSRFATKRGFTSTDVERTTSDVCGCNLHQFFEDHVRNARALNFNRYLPVIGLRVVIDTVPAADSAGTRFPDMRIWAFRPRSAESGRMRVMVEDPAGVWGKAGLHTGQELVAFNGAPIDSMPSFRRAIRGVKLGDVVPVDIIRNGKTERVNVRVASYDEPRVRIVDVPSVTPAQRERRRLWLSASPTW
jgi:predicted metalloprotease with PDZ domain